MWIPRAALMLILDFVLVFCGFYVQLFNFFWSATNNIYLTAIAFVFLSSIPSDLLELPFELADEFSIEKKFGFSNMSFKMWICDRIKSLAVNLIVSVPLLCAACALLSHAGSIVLYRPKELQKYEYYGEDKTEVYWIHFTGSNVKNILRQYGFPDKERVFQVGTSNEYEQIFKRIIIELQRCQDNYEEMLVLLLRHLLISFHRELTREHILKNEYLDHEMDNAVTFFSENYNQNINIDNYAASRGMSVSWFIRNFKKYTGSTPMQFIVGIRINNAQMLLETTTYSINEISKIVGYDNQLYFSRLFHKLKGYSPREYRKIRNRL